MIKVVLDANVFVSAVLKPDSNPGRILELVRNGSLLLCVSPDTLAELQTTLLYPKLRKLHQRSSRWVSGFVRELSKIAQVTPGTLIVSAITEDPSDNIYLACAVEGHADYIVSGDNHLLKLGTFQDISIMNPADFLKTVGVA